MAVIELGFAVLGAWTLVSLAVAGLILVRRTSHDRRGMSVSAELPSREHAAT